MPELIIRPWRQLIGLVKLYIKRWTTPATARLTPGILSDTTRSRLDLIAENALLGSNSSSSGVRSRGPR